MEREVGHLRVSPSRLGRDRLGSDDADLMRQARNLDIVLGGHPHAYFNALEYVDNLDGREIPNDQNGKHGIYVGKITVDFSR